MVKIHSNVWFDRVILFFILFNCVVMAMEEPGLHHDGKVCYVCVVDIFMLCFCSTFLSFMEMFCFVFRKNLLISCSIYLQQYLQLKCQSRFGYVKIHAFVCLHA